MARLIGAQKLVLQAILDIQGASPSFVDDVQIAQTTRIALNDVRDWLETLEGEGYVDVARTEAGLSASITAKGKLVFKQFHPIKTTPAPTSLPSTPSNPPETPSMPRPGVPPSQVPLATPVRLFYSYSHDDESLRDELAKHLAVMRRQGVISGWHDRRIGEGDEWKGAIDKNLEEAQVILLLVSSSFLASDYCWDVETNRAVERHDRGEARVIPVILRPCDWQEAPFARLQGLPKDAKAVTTWPNRDEAWTDVAKGIRRAVEAMRSGHSVTPLPGNSGVAQGESGRSVDHATESGVPEALRPIWGDSFHVNALISEVEQYLADDRQQVKLDRLVKRVTEASRAAAIELHKRSLQLLGTPEVCAECITQYDSMLKPILAVTIMACRWGGSQHIGQWVGCIDRMAGILGEDLGFSQDIDLRSYPATLLFYGGGVASVAASRYDMLQALFEKTQVRRWGESTLPAARVLHGPARLNARSAHLGLIFCEIVTCWC